MRTKTKIAVALVVLSVGFAGVAVGQDDPIAARQGLMKQNASMVGIASALAKGERPYNAALAAATMEILAYDLEVFPTLFPENSMEGGDPPTRAKAEIWQDMAGFEATAAKLVETANAAAAAAPEGQEAFAAALGAVGQVCGDCHDAYRGPRPN
jgi:cytochrome c556